MPCAKLRGVRRLGWGLARLRASNHAGILVGMIQSARQTHHHQSGRYPSIAIHDALKAFVEPIIEVHIHARDELHPHSKLSSAVKGVICGLGPCRAVRALQAASSRSPELRAAPARAAG